jgi:hypothetical protein
MVAFTVSLFFAMEAQATSRFSVQNDTDEKVNVYIYTGGDTVCSIHEKLKSVGPGKNSSFGCTGNGKQRCNVKFKQQGNQVCKINKTKCGARAIRVPNKVEVTLAYDENGEVVCNGKKPPEKTDTAAQSPQS